MPRRRLSGRLHLLSVREILCLETGGLCDGGGLYLRCTGALASWVFRYTSPAGKRREMGLGPCHRQNSQMAGDSLRQAREAAATARKMLAEFPPRDPIDEREKAKEAARADLARQRGDRAESATTLARVARAYHEKHVEPKLGTAQSARWIGALEKHIPEKLWSKPVARVTSAELLEVLIDLQNRYDDTAQRVRRRLDEILDDAADRGVIPGNPMATLRHKLARRHKPGRDIPRPSLAFAELPAFMASLSQREGIAARCLAFVILTAARTSEAIGATWDEINFQTQTWTIPASRMKAGEVHTVALSPQVVRILEDQQALGSKWVFPSPTNPQKPLSNMAMLNMLERMGRTDITVHGFRATFSTWAHETDAARPDVVEACLAHRETDRIRAAYNRATFATDRRKLLLSWAAFATGSQVTTLRSAIAA